MRIRNKVKLRKTKPKSGSDLLYENSSGVKLNHLYDDTRWNPEVVSEIPEKVKLGLVLRSGSMEGSRDRLIAALKTESKSEVAETLKHNFGISGYGGLPDEHVAYDDYRISAYDFMGKKNSVTWLVNSIGYYKAEFSYSQFADWCFKYEKNLQDKVLSSPKPKRRLKIKKRNRLTKSESKKAGSPSLTIIEEENEWGYTGEWWNVRSDDKEANFPLNPAKKKMDVIDNEADLKLLCEHMMSIPAFAYDTETNTLDVCADNEKFRCSDITISWGENNNYDILVGKMREEDVYRNIDLDVLLKHLKPVFEREDVTIVGANLKYDLHVMNRLGIHVKTRKLFDTELAAWLCDENSFINLKFNSGRYMKVAQTKFKETTDSIPKEVKKQYGYAPNSKVNDFCLVSVEDGKDYCTDDSFYTWCLYWGFQELLEVEGMDVIYRSRMIPFMLVLLDMEERGVAVDRDRLEKMQHEMEEDLERLKYEIYEVAGVEFNIGSSQQLCEILYGTVKPDKPILKDKVSKALQKILDDYKEGKFDREALTLKLDKQGIYIDDRGKMWRRQNVNQHLVNVNFGFPVLAQTKGGSPSVDKHTLRRLAQQDYKRGRKKEGVEMCRKILEYSKLEKLKGTFADGILEKINIYSDGRCHPNFRQTGTDSGRISCASPNLQQLPNADESDKYQIRSVFIGGTYYKAAESGNLYNTYEEFKENEPKELQRYGYVLKAKKILAIDYHNLEMVCLTYFSHDRNLTKMFANDDDAHGSTAVNMFGLDCTPTECKKKYPHLRQAAKTLNFLLMYGGGAQLLYENLKYDPWSPVDLGSKEMLKKYGVRTGREVAQIYIDRYFETYSGVAKFIRDQKRYAHMHEYVWTISGRKRRLPDVNSSDGEKSSKSERLSVNATIQGTAGDITSSAQIRLYKPEVKEKLDALGAKMLLQVHDELVYEYPEENEEEVIKTIKYYMEHPFGDKKNQQVPYLRADAGVGYTYQEAK